MNMVSPYFLMVSLVFSLAWSPLAIGQEHRAQPAQTAPLNYSSDNPEWLTFVAGKNPSGGVSWLPSWKLPSWKKSGASGWWSSDKKASSYSKNNKSTMQRISQTSKRWWNNTLEFLDPYAPPKERPSSGPSDSGFFGKLFGSNTSATKFNSVPEWASQPMPK